MSNEIKQSAKTGTATTDEGKEVELVSPAVPDGAKDVNELSEDEKNAPLTRDEQQALLGELEPGESGWVPLDDKGRVTGPAQKGIPPVDQPAARVIAPADTRPPLLATPSGAPVTKHMQPDPSLAEKAKAVAASGEASQHYSESREFKKGGALSAETKKS